MLKNAFNTQNTTGNLKIDEKGGKKLSKFSF